MMKMRKSLRPCKPKMNNFSLKSYKHENPNASNQSTTQEPNRSWFHQVRVMVAPWPKIFSKELASNPPMSKWEANDQLLVTIRSATTTSKISIQSIISKITSTSSTPSPNQYHCQLSPCINHLPKVKIKDSAAKWSNRLFITMALATSCSLEATSHHSSRCAVFSPNSRSRLISKWLSIRLRNAMTSNLCIEI